MVEQHTQSGQHAASTSLRGSLVRALHSQHGAASSSMQPPRAGLAHTAGSGSGRLTESDAGDASGSSTDEDLPGGAHPAAGDDLWSDESGSGCEDGDEEEGAGAGGSELYVMPAPEERYQPELSSSERERGSCGSWIDQHVGASESAARCELAQGMPGVGGGGLHASIVICDGEQYGAPA